ncbi:MAG: hypothetical protein ACLUOI_20700 [Eisenbergiella sp.]
MACNKPGEQVIKVMNDPGYDELQENTWLRGSLWRPGGARGTRRMA